MAVIHAKGLLEGKRLRRCSPRARLFWPYLFLMSNGYARIEVDHELLEEKFLAFRDQAPGREEIAKFFAEYAANHLIYIYAVAGREWGQWDTPRYSVQRFKNGADRLSPAPPEPAYTEWLKEQNGDRWRNCHWDAGVNGEIPGKVTENLPLISPSGVGVGEGVGEGKRKNLSSEVSTTSDKNSRSEPSEDGWKLARLMQAEILALKPDFRISDATLRGWAEVADKMFRLDHRDPVRAADLLRRVYRDDFWQKNVLCMRTFRQKFDQLELKLIGKPDLLAGAKWVPR